MRESVAVRLLGLWIQPLRGHVYLSLVSVCYQVEVSATGRSLIQRNPTECGVCDREASIMRRSWPTVGLLRHGGKNVIDYRNIYETYFEMVNEYTNEY